MNDEHLTQRMRAASEAIQMSESSQARHLEAISAALSSVDATSDADVVALSVTRASRRRRIVASVVAAAVIAPAGLAAASEGSVPGDALYPVKQISERVLVIFDSDVIAQHRIEEIEVLEAAGRFDAELYDDARTALTELGEDHPLWQRLAAAAPDDDNRTDQAISDDDDRSDDDAAGVVMVELALPDGAEATVTIADDELVSVDVPNGWILTEIDDDEATLESDGYIVVIELTNGSLELDVTDRGQSDDDDSDDTEVETTSTTAVSDDDASSETETTSTTDADERVDDSDSAEPDSSDDERNDDDTSESP